MGNILQFYYGDDGLDPASIEGADSPVEFTRNLKHAISIHCGDEEKEYLLPWQILEEKEKQLRSDRFKSCSNEFLNALHKFMEDSVVKNLVNIRIVHGLSTGLDKNEKWNSEVGEYIYWLIKDLITKNNITRNQLNTYFHTCCSKYAKAMMEPGNLLEY